MSNSSSQTSFRLRFSSFLILLSFAFSILPLTVKAQTEPAKTRQLITENNSSNNKRLALVIGNADYKYTSKLKNSANDAIDIAATLGNLGFEVISGVDQDRRQMDLLIREFGSRLGKQGGTGVFFYAGHGVQYDGRNYLIPVDADIAVENEIEYKAYDIGQLMRKLVTAKNDLNIVILDACRNNPFAEDWSEYRDVNQDNGLAKTVAPKGTVVVYATEPGKVASDGEGRNGVFTEAFLNNVKKPNVELDLMIKSVQRAVSEKTKNSKNPQNPYREGTNYGDFYFAGTSDNPTPGRQPPVIPTEEAEPVIKEKDAATREKEVWDAIKTSNDAEAFQIYLEEFPNGANARSARVKREQLVWNSIKTTEDKSKVIAFLEEFPRGANAPMAKIKLRKIETGETAEILPPTEEIISEAKPKTEKLKLNVVAKVVKPRNKNLAAKYEMKSNSFGMEMVQIPAGNFLMGTSERLAGESLRYARKEYADVEPDWFDNEKPQRRVTFSEDFWIGKTEVTQAQWTAVMGSSPVVDSSCGDCPIYQISWEDVQIFLQKLNEKNDGFEYHLPSEAQWEYAARAGSTGLFAGPIDAMSWHSGNSEGKIHPTAAKQPNAFGLFDMNGNVEEWCEDVYSQTYDEMATDGTPNLNIGDKRVRVVRGGSWNKFPSKSRSMAREKVMTTAISATIGFRVAARLKNVEQ